MRYYKIVISDPNTGKILVPNPVTRIFQRVAPSASVATYTSLAGDPALGVTLPGALNIEFDIPVYAMSQPLGGSHLRIYGISLQEIAQRSDLNGKMIDVFAGMARGLPLAKPQQAGLIFHGKIFQAFGNWQGTNQTLEFVIQPDFGTPDVPRNISFHWRAGTSLSDALTVTLSTAFPDYAIKIAISPNLRLAHDEPGYYHSLPQFAQMLNGITKAIIGGDYGGVQIMLNGKTIVVMDGTQTLPGLSSPSSPKQIAFEDMIGQPTWIDTGTVNVSFVMRHDLAVNDYIQFPTGLMSPYVLTMPNAAVPNQPASSKTAFQGVFSIRDLHHFGSFRQPDANAWVTMVNAVSVLLPPTPLTPPRG